MFIKKKWREGGKKTTYIVCFHLFPYNSIKVDFFFLTLIAAIDAPGGFLFEWWSVFWDIFIARTNEKHSEPAASYIEVGLFFN